MNKVNYGEICDRVINDSHRAGIKPRLLLHVCCAPCSSYCLEYLENHFDITLYYYNPNITEAEEFTLRLDELTRFVGERGGENFKIISPEYNTEEYFRAVKGYESIPEGGERCFKCYELRLEKTAIEAKNGGYDYFTTTLSISPYKNSDKLCEIGAELEEKYGVKYLYSDFKKKNGYKRSIELSQKFGLYRQDYCGCIYSRLEAEKRRREKNG